MVKKIVVNADDYGLCEGVVLGILKAHKDGILTSTTCMMNMPNIERYLLEAMAYPDLGLGVHLNITIGPSLTGVLCDESRHFSSENKKTVDEKLLYQEWKAQIEKFISLTGKKPTHLDSHHHVHLLEGNIDVALKLAREYDIPLRQETYLQTDYENIIFKEVFYNKTVSKETLLSILEREEELFELMCHPAYIDHVLYTSSRYALPRCHELALLLDDEIKVLYQDKLISYKDIKKIR